MSLQWDVFCRVVDNWGDAGVCWRLAATLAARGEQVRLWIDDPSPLAWMAPRGASGVEVIAWREPLAEREPGDVVVEAFGCDPPPAFVERMAARERPPVWINLEYLSAESWGERSHRLPSPCSTGPGAGLTKWFFYPGFSASTGGLLRGAALDPTPAGAAALERAGAGARPGERVVVLFRYAGAPVEALLASLADEPTLLLAAQVEPPAALPSSVRWHALPRLPQPDFDRLLAAADLNFVRGEDSFVQAQWAAQPFVWQIYPQHDGVHATKLEAFLDCFLAEAEPGLAQAIRVLHRGWNGLAGGPLELPPLPAWRRHCQSWQKHLLGQADLATGLQQLVAEKR